MYEAAISQSDVSHANDYIIVSELVYRVQGTLASVC